MYIWTSHSWRLGQFSSGQIKELRYGCFSLFNKGKKTEAAALSHVGTHRHPKFRLTISPLSIITAYQIPNYSDFQHICMYGNNERTNKQIHSWRTEHNLEASVRGWAAEAQQPATPLSIYDTLTLMMASSRAAEQPFVLPTRSPARSMMVCF